ncbi:MAG: DNA polymerase III subunit delta [Candidatus Omnitrophica bacterium CG11_big_fil_rev_8_21_14_0_20_64_10]|nr:MAG: DNA polymerase III subunit delta [Candidatus Omnitrophica bacterium CG11_big_fil_rev_8_21_14_0_20_64_10]
MLPAGLFLIGADRQTQERLIGRLKARALAPGFEAADSTRLDLPLESPPSLWAALATQPFASPARVVEVTGCRELGEKELPGLTPYLENPPDWGCLIVAAEKIASKTEPVLRKHRARFEIRVFAPLKPQALPGWVAEEAKRSGKSIEPAAAALLVRRVGTEPGALKQAVQTVALLVGAGERIGRADVERLIPPSAQETAFDILDAAAGGRLPEAIAALHGALRENRISIEKWMGAAGWYLRMAWKSRSGRGSGFGSPARSAALNRLQRWPAPQAAAALGRLSRWDLELKQGHPAPDWIADQVLLLLSGSG